LKGSHYSQPTLKNWRVELHFPAGGGVLDWKHWDSPNQKTACLVGDTVTRWPCVKDSLCSREDRQLLPLFLIPPA
jgi:hypothetical protein